MNSLNVVATIVNKNYRLLACIGPQAGVGTTTAARCLAVALTSFSLSPVLLLSMEAHAGDVAATLDPEYALKPFPEGAFPALAGRSEESGTLRLMTVGSDIPQAALFDAAKAAPLWMRIKKQFEYAVIDLRNFSTHPELAALIRQMDAAVLILDCRTTRWETALDMKRRLEESGAALAGVILNRRQYPVPASLYQAM